MKTKIIHSQINRDKSKISDKVSCCSKTIFKSLYPLGCYTTPNYPKRITAKNQSQAQTSKGGLHPISDTSTIQRTGEICVDLSSVKIKPDTLRGVL